jgi:hypothetical protein
VRFKCNAAFKKTTRMVKRNEKGLVWIVSALCLSAFVLYLLVLFKDGYMLGSSQIGIRKRYAKICDNEEAARELTPELCAQSRFIGESYAIEAGFRHTANILYNKLEGIGWFTVSVVVAGFVLSYVMMSIASAGEKMNLAARMLSGQVRQSYIEDVDEVIDERPPLRRIGYR